jgi:phage tail tape-measure protein
MDVRRFKEFCQRLDELAAILEIMECDPIDADLHREASNALNQALSENERLRSDADQHRETSNALRDALAEIERLRSGAADLHPAKFDIGLSNRPLASIATDWFMKFLERKQAISGEKVTDRKGDAE